MLKLTINSALCHQSVLKLTINSALCHQSVLREDVKEKFKYEVDRSTPSNKLRELMDWSNDITQDINYTRRVLKNRVARFFVNYWSVSDPVTISTLSRSFTRILLNNCFVDHFKIMYKSRDTCKKDKQFHLEFQS